MDSSTITKRQEKLFEYVYKNKYATVSEIAEKMNISNSTVRRDIRELKKTGKLSNFHSGVTVHQDYETFTERNQQNHEEKKQIAKAAADYVENGDVIYIGGGSTTMMFTQEITTRTDLSKVTIVTSALNIASRCLKNPRFRVIIPGGEPISMDESMSSKITMDTIRKIEFTKVFIGCIALNAENGLMYPQQNLNELKKIVINNTNQVFVLIDSTKIGQEAALTACPVERINILFTDSKAKKMDSCKKMIKKGLIVKFA